MKIALSAGEESGDILGSDLMRSLKAHDDKIEFIGIGGERMKQDGLESLFPINEISKMGIIDPLLSLKTILKRRKQLISFFESQKPDIFIGIDSPSFNLGISKKLNYLFIGNSKPSNSKIEKAKNLGVKILTETEWYKILKI